MTFILYLYGKMSVKTAHFSEVLDAIHFLKDKYSLELMIESLISSREYHLENFQGDRLIDIFVYG